MKCTGCVLCAPLHIIWHEQENKREERREKREWVGGGGSWVSEILVSTLEKMLVCVCVPLHWEEDWISSPMLKSICYSVDYIGVLLKRTHYFVLSC